MKIHSSNDSSLLKERLIWKELFQVAASNFQEILNWQSLKPTGEGATNAAKCLAITQLGTVSKFHY